MSSWNETCSQAPSNHEPTEGEINKALIIDFVEGVKRENAQLKKFASGLELNLAAVIRRAEAAEAKLACVPSEEEWARLKANDGIMLDLEAQLAARGKA